MEEDQILEPELTQHEENVLSVPIRKRCVDMTPEEKKLKGQQLALARQVKRERLAKEKELQMEAEIQRRVTERLLQHYESNKPAATMKKQTAKKKIIYQEAPEPEEEIFLVAKPRQKRVVAPPPSDQEFDDGPIEAYYQQALPRPPPNPMPAYQQPSQPLAPQPPAAQPRKWDI